MKPQWDRESLTLKSLVSDELLPFITGKIQTWQINLGRLVLSFDYCVHAQYTCLPPLTAHAATESIPPVLLVTVRLAIIIAILRILHNSKAGCGKCDKNRQEVYAQQVSISIRVFQEGKTLKIITHHGKAPNQTTETSAP